MKSFKSFNLKDDILKGIESLNYNNPTEVQEKVISEALLNKDLIVMAKTGSGKTAAFGIPLCEKIEWEEGKSEAKALILAPTRELAIQITEDLKNIGRFKRLKIVSLIGKESFKEQEDKLKRKVHIIVGTPGRVLDHLDKETLNGKALEYLVVDEADQMFNMGFIKDVEKIMREINKKRVTMLFSATLPEAIEELIKKHMNRPITIKCNSEKVANEKITHGIIEVEGREKLEKLKEILLRETPKRAIIFCRTKENVELCYKFLRNESYSVDYLHGDMLQKDRNKKMDRFREGEFRFLVATDIASRGLDVEDVTHVINLDIPVEKEAYVHRIGRTGRGSKSGKSITLMTPYEKKYLDRIEEYLGFKIEEYREISIENREKAEEFLKSNPEKRKNVKKNIQGVTKIYLNGGKKKKIRILDIVGTICTIDGIEKDDIGVIQINDMNSTVEIFNNKGKKVLQELKKKTIKGKQLKVEIARD